jgi:hypothetical protein
MFSLFTHIFIEMKLYVAQAAKKKIHKILLKLRAEQRDDDDDDDDDGKGKEI